ncbi:MAG: hypothetical protein DRI95_13255 [Bacteroidetes bacterium]|nr:MAG: hypothetical protein DRI95_13255 [Bacteroidota bacterium]
MDIEQQNMHTYFEQLKEVINSNSLKTNSSKQLDVFHLFQNECIFVLDYTQNKIIYKKGFYKVTGYPDDEITSDFIINNFHPDDAYMVNRIIRATITYCIEHPKNSANNLLIIKHRIRKRDGSYINIINQSSIYRRDERGRISMALIRFTDITGMDNAKEIIWTFNSSNLNKEAFNRTVYKVYQGFFTKREPELIREIEKALINKEIAVKLGISEYTVATHRKSILKKSDCHNTKELILFCRERSII